MHYTSHNVYVLSKAVRHISNQTWDKYFSLWHTVAELGHCNSYKRYRPSQCFPPPCARPPENCRQDFIYDNVNGEWCPVACRLVCECPTPTPESLEFCKNTDPLCFATKDLITLEDGKRCFNGCLLACQSPAGWRKKFLSQQ